MVTQIRIYLEGGGDGSDTKAAIRSGFNKFLEPLLTLARNRGLRWTLTACGPRNAAFDMFKTAVRSHPGAFNVLLVDSEAPVTRSPWKHLEARDGWRAEVSEDHCHLMVCTVEAWLLADPDTLASFYGQGFHRNALPKRQDVEEIPKEDLLRSLTRATERTRSKGSYQKIQHCALLLQQLDPAVVRPRARHCDRLFAVLGSLIRSA